MSHAESRSESPPKSRRWLLHQAIPREEANGDLEIQLEGEKGWAIAPLFNRAIHAVEVLRNFSQNRLETWNLRIELHPDAWFPKTPLIAEFCVELGSGRDRFQGRVEGKRVEGRVESLPLQSLLEGTFHLCCQQLLTDGRVDFRDLRLELPLNSGRIESGRAVTLHEEWPIVPAEVIACEWNSESLRAEVSVVHPPFRFRLNLEAERRGTLLRGRWKDSKSSREGDLWGRFHTTPIPKFREFVSPGMLLGKEDIAGAKLRSVDEKWAPAWALLRDRTEEWRNWKPRPHAKPHFIHWSEPGPVRDLKEDCEAAWGNAILYALTSDETHASAASRIIYAWATTFKEIADIGGHLSISYSFPALIWAADLIRSYDRLGSDIDTALRECLSQVVRPIACTELHINSNWRSWANHLEACIAVYCLRGDWFDLALERYRSLLATYTHSPRGITSETERDLVHAQMGIAPMLATCELAWRHGVDLYAERQMRLRAAVEFHGPFALGQLEDWPLATPARDVGQVWPMYELAVRHYRGRLGIPMPRSCSVLDAIRPEGFNRIGWGTLLHPWEWEERAKCEPL